MATVSRSSTTVQPIAMWPICACRSWRSPSTRAITTVLATEMAMPRMIPEIQLQPKRRSSSASMAVDSVLWMSAPGMATRQTAISSRRWKRSPIPNSSRITPISANCSAIARLATKPGVKGPTATPASR